MPVSPRSLADDLRNRNDDQIIDLLTNRSDLLRPVPASISDLALSANTSGSVSSALNQLSATDLTVLEASCALVPDHKLTTRLLEDSLVSESTQTNESVGRLWGLALLWGPLHDLRVPSAVRDSMGPQPCGLDQVIRGRDPNAATLTVATLEDGSAFTSAPPGTPELLQELTWQNPIMAIHDGVMPSPAEWLYRHKILISAGESAVALPRQTSLELRHGRLLLGPMPTAPDLVGKSWPQSQSDATAAHSADLFIRTVDRVVDSLGTESLILRNRGGLAVRHWQVRADDLHVSAAHLALAIEIASSTGWLGDNGSGRLVPTARYFQDIDAPRPDRWTQLATAWFTMPRRPWFDSPGAEELPTSTPLSPDLTDEQTPVTKADMLLALNNARSSLSPTVMLSWLGWRCPRASPSALVVRELMAQAEFLGITGLGTISPAGVTLSAGESSRRISAALEPLLPPTSDRLLLQADLTATAPAALTSRTERRLARAADFVSSGGASVYRFTHESIARGLAHGEQPDALLDWLGELSDTDVPQAVSVLVNDVAREQGDVRVVAAAAALTGDPETLSKLLSRTELGQAGLGQLSATALTSTVAPNELVPMLRSAGIRVHEAPETVTQLQSQHEEPTRQVAEEDSTGLRERVVAALRVVEAGTSDDDAPLVPSAPPAPSGAAELTRSLREATDSGSQVWLEFSDASGSMQTHLMMPIDVSGGIATLLNRTQSVVQSISLSRILAVMLDNDGGEKGPES